MKRASSRTKVRRWRWRHNPLRRRSDTIEAWTRVVLGTALFLGAPLAGSLAGLTMYDQAQATAAQQRASRHLVRATVLEDVPTSPASTDGAATRQVSPVAVRWTTSDGRTVTGNVKMPEGTRSGSPTDIWVDTHDRTTTAPRSSSDSRAQAMGVGGVTTTAAGLAVGGLWLAFRSTANRRRMAEWERDWAVTGPQWGLRSH
ncbi:Rv1733c family protein [Streptomyces sp. HUAS TT7]|uniref:Rv1733c family protein n=1 Tax=Streptomyces sp. HUAS TT7 TaxID=3447507 RepID=UPI003F65931B